MKLKDLLKDIEILEVRSLSFQPPVSSFQLPDINIESISFDSRNINKGTLFIAVKGTRTDGHNYINDVIKNGAIAIVCEFIPETLVNSSSLSVDRTTNNDQRSTKSALCTLVKVSDSNTALGYIASAFYDNPSKKLKLVGITGTNGKTTVATLLYNLFRKAGNKSGLISTVRYLIDETEVNATHTTPDAIQLNHLLSRMVNEGCTYCFMEVSSHSIVQKRITGLTFAGAVFTNITHDHLDYHKTFEEYLKAKKTLFDNLGKDAFALSNIDDKNGNVILQNTKAVKKTYSLQKLSDFRAKLIQNDFSGMQINIDGTDVWSRLVGNFNAYNLLAIYATAILLNEVPSPKSQVSSSKPETNLKPETWNLKPETILKLLSTLNPVEGRFEVIQSQSSVISAQCSVHSSQLLSTEHSALSTELSTEHSALSTELSTEHSALITAIVDYAHTPDALFNVLKTIREISSQCSVEPLHARAVLSTVHCALITVVGCGGDRDKTKRPVMAKIAFENSDILILTSDNPRTEDPEQIIAEMLQGIPVSTVHSAQCTVHCIVDRREAIKTACTLAKKIVGTAHELSSNQSSVPSSQLLSTEHRALSTVVILVAGKGHETYQDIKGTKYPFDDKKILKEILNSKLIQNLKFKI